jgi:hypothetical protein
MKAKILLMLIGSILFLQGCATKVKMTAVASRDQKTAFDGTITSQKKHFVSLSPYNEIDLAKDKAIFMVSIQNGGETPINITNDTISVIFEEIAKKENSDTINIQALDDFIDDLEEEYDNKEKYFIDTNLWGIKNDIEYKTPSPTTEELADLFEDLRTDIERMRLNNEMLREALPDFYIKPQIIMSGDNFSGIVVCDTSDIDSETVYNLRVFVSIDGEVHNFTFKRGLSM